MFQDEKKKLNEFFYLFQSRKIESDLFDMLKNWP